MTTSSPFPGCRANYEECGHLCLEHPLAVLTTRTLLEPCHLAGWKEGSARQLGPTYRGFSGSPTPSPGSLRRPRLPAPIPTSGQPRRSRPRARPEPGTLRPGLPPAAPAASSTCSGGCRGTALHSGQVASRQPGPREQSEHRYQSVMLPVLFHVPTSPHAYSDRRGTGAAGPAVLRRDGGL